MPQQNPGDYLREVFCDLDEQQRTLMHRAADAGLPEIAVSSDVGRLLMLMVSMTPATRVVEVGTLGGYSTIWLARGLAPAGRLITIEKSDAHADFAQREIDRAGLADLVQIRRGSALDVLPELAQEFGDHSLDATFLDAVKCEYPAYLETLAPMLRVGGVLLADNALGGGDWWITDKPGNPSRDTIDAFNRTLARDPRFTTACIANREGTLVARKRA